MKEKNRILRISAVLILAISMCVMLSSCLLSFDFPYFDDENPSYGFEDQYQQNNGGKDETPKDEGNNTVGGDNTAGDNFNGFYPVRGDGDASGVSKKARTLLSTVDIIVESTTSSGAGSGIIYKLDKEKGDAYIITNQHVVYADGKASSAKISVYLYGMESASYAIPATFVGGSVTYDIAVIKITGSEVLKNSYAMAAELADSDELRVFDTVYAVGNAAGSGISVTDGIVSVETESLQLTGADNSVITLRVLRFDAAVNHGNSGGGLYDEQGRLVGVVCAKDVGSNVDNMGYAIPVDLAIKVANNILHYCDNTNETQMKKALMGVTITAYVSGLEIEDDGDLRQVQMVEVIEISPSSLADGKVKVGDVVNSITVDGIKTEVTYVHHVTDAMIDARDGSTVVMNVTRGDEVIDITFTIPAGSVSSVK